MLLRASVAPIAEYERLACEARRRSASAELPVLGDALGLAPNGGRTVRSVEGRLVPPVAWFIARGRRHEHVAARRVAGMDFSPSGLAARALRTRALVRAPITLYRHGLGWFFGQRVLMLEHTGRRSGLPRFVCLEIVDRPDPNRIVIVSGFGARAEWYRNLQADYTCFVSTGRLRRIPARARFMTSAETMAALSRYQHAHPRAWEQLRQAIEKAAGHPVDQLPMVELNLGAVRSSN